MTAEIPAVMACTSCIGTFLANLLPTKTAGTSAMSVPRVVPAIIVNGVVSCAARATVAICVLSPFSAKKKVSKVAPKTPKSVAACVSYSSILSGMSVQIVMPMNEPPNTQRMTSGLITDVTHVPEAPAKPWSDSKVKCNAAWVNGWALNKRPVEILPPAFCEDGC